jgi:hypothetical protein
MKTAAKRSINKTVSSANMTGAVKEYRLPTFQHEDGEGIVIPVQPVVIVSADNEPATFGNSVKIEDGSDSGLSVSVSNTIGSLGYPTYGNASLAQTYLLNMLSQNEPLRTPGKFVHALCTTVAATVVWDPAAGKKFRLMGYVIIPAAGMAAAGIQLITLLDEAAAITIAHQVYLPAAANVVNQAPIVVQLPGNGFLSVAADNRLSVTLTSACTAGAISVMAYGTEE